MKKMGELMKELGFRPGANEEVTKAFIKNLIREAQVQDLSRKKQVKASQSEEQNISSPTEQLSLFEKRSS